METGGAFGGKEEYPSMIAAHAALLAMKSGKPVKIIYDRMEDMAATTKRHPSRTRHRTAVSKDGKILGGEIDFTIDGGAYKTLSPVVLSRGAIHAGGAYYWPSIRIRAKAVATNMPPHGAFRGFGAPQSLFALERHMDRIAQVVGLSPVEIRRRNFLKPGQTTTTGQTVNEEIDLGKLLDRALELSDYHAKKERFAQNNQLSAHKKGMGIAAFLHGAGFTGSGERFLGSVVGVEAIADGSLRILVSSTEFGQGTNTVLCQIVAEALGLRYEDVSIAQPDTHEVPNSGPTVASRTVMVVGKLVQSAAVGIRKTLIASGMLSDSYAPEEFRAACRGYVAKHGKIRSLAQYEQPEGIFWDDEKYRGEAYAAFAWAVYIAEVTADLTTYSVTVDDFVALQEIGKVLHPVLAKGQIIGGVAQGIGFALYEKVIWENGRMQNGQMTNYIMPTSADLPPIRVYFEELGNVHGAYGAKGIGELPMDGPAPAIVNAIEDALQIFLPFDSVASRGHLRRAFRKCDARGCGLNAPRARMSQPLLQSAKCEISLTVNGKQETLHVYPMERLLDVLRHELGLTGTKEGCGEGECGSCSVLIDGMLVNSCLVPALQANARDHRHDRRPRDGRPPAIVAAVISRLRRRPVRYLHSRNDSRVFSPA